MHNLSPRTRFCLHENMPDLPTSLVDTLNRNVRDLRISVTDRCNLRCIYCMPRSVFGKGFSFLPRDELLSFEEIERIARQSIPLEV